MIKNKLKPINIEGSDYYTMQQFALLTEKSIQTIRHLVCYTTNLTKKIKHTTFANQIFIPASELYTYKWKFPGKGELYYSFNEDGERIFNKDIKV